MSAARDELRDCFLSDSRDRFETAADTYRAEVLAEAADDLVAACPDHSDSDEVWMDCPCEYADELRRMAAIAGAA